MPDQATESANNVLDSVHRRFVDETYGGLFFESIFKTREQLSTLLIGDEAEQLFAKSRIVHGGMHDWLESLVKLTHSYAGRLIAIIMADSQICSSENPAQWIRLWLEDHLRKYLRQELNLKKLVQRSIAVKHPGSVSEGQFPPNVRRGKHTGSRVESWLQRIADDDWRVANEWPDAPIWLAPVWCEEESSVRFMLRKTGTCPTRLTLEQTARVIRRRENDFGARLEYVLGVVEDEARITIAQQPRVARRNLTPQSSPLTGSQGGPAATGDAGSDLSMTPIENRNGDSEQVLGGKVARKLKNPDAHPLMSVEEAAHALGKSRASIYRYVSEQKKGLSWFCSKGKLRTKDIKRLIETPSE